MKSFGGIALSFFLVVSVLGLSVSGQDPGAPPTGGAGITPMVGGGGGVVPPANALPEIVDYDYVLTGALLTFYGKVVDDGPTGGLLVVIQGRPGNFITVTDDDGWWSVTLDLQQGWCFMEVFAYDSQFAGGPSVYIPER